MKAQVAAVKAQVLDTVRPTLPDVRRSIEALDLPERIRGLIDSPVA